MNVISVDMIRRANNATERRQDLLAVEEPLEIQLGYEEEGKRTFRSISITMRTPGEDHELAAGFLFSEGIITRAQDIQKIRHCGKPVVAQGLRNTVRVELSAGCNVDLQKLQRHFYTTSSCGVCGKSSIEALQTVRSLPVSPISPPLPASVVHQLPKRLQEQQELFRTTGGIHAAGLFDRAGMLLTMHEDVGRHNAVDKVIGHRLLENALPLDGLILVVSGRASFELVQKAVVAGVSLLASVGAPSSLAVELAAKFGMALVGFVRDDRLNVYSGGEQLLLEE